MNPQLEAVTIIDLLRRAQINVVVAGLDQKPVLASRGTTLQPDTTLDNVESGALDMIALPGGLPGADHLNNDPRIHALIQQLSTNGKYVSAICAAPKVLLNTGVLTGRRITCYPGALSELDCSDITITSDPVVIDGNIITSRGPGTAIDFALTLIEILTGIEKRNEVEVGLSR